MTAPYSRLPACGLTDICDCEGVGRIWSGWNPCDMNGASLVTVPPPFLEDMFCANRRLDAERCKGLLWVCSCSLWMRSNEATQPSHSS